jgi:hypothetical protein
LVRRYSSHQMGRVLTISASKPDTMIFSGNAQSYANHSRGFTPAAVAPPYAINHPGQVLRHPRSAQGRYGGTGSSPLLHRTCILNFIAGEKEFCRASFLTDGFSDRMGIIGSIESGGRVQQRWWAQKPKPPGASSMRFLIHREEMSVVKM